MRKIIIVFGIFLLICAFYPSFHVYSGEHEIILTDKNKNTRAAHREYRIGKGDILGIFAWKEPDISRDNVLVRIDGKISFPLLGDVQAAGKTPAELRLDLEKRLREFMEISVITVTVINPMSQRFYILGEVARIGEYPLIKELTVLQAFSIAGGFSQWAKRKEILLLRRVENKEEIIEINYNDIIKGKDFSQNVLLRAGDTIIVK